MNIYEDPEDKDCLGVDINGLCHKAVLSESLSEGLEVLDIERFRESGSMEFKVNPENVRQIISNGNIYEISDKRVQDEELGDFLGIIASELVYDADTMREIPKAELNKLDWLGTDETKRETAFYFEVYSIVDKDAENEIAVMVNDEFLRAIRQK